MAWKQYNENNHQDDLPELDADTGEPLSLDKKQKTERGFSASDIIALWNSYPTFADLKKKKGMFGTPRNPTTHKLLLPTAKDTKDLRYALGAMMKRYELKDFETVFENYIKELIHRSPKDSWAGRRYSLYEIINPKRDTFKIYLNK